MMSLSTSWQRLAVLRRIKADSFANICNGACKKDFSPLSVFSQNRSIAARHERQLMADSVEKVGHGFHGRKVRA